MSDEYMWIKCPQCSKRLFKLFERRRFNIQIKCSGCRAIVRVASDGSSDVSVSVEQPGKRWPPEMETK